MKVFYEKFIKKNYLHDLKKGTKQQKKKNLGVFYVIIYIWKKKPKKPQKNTYVKSVTSYRLTKKITKDILRP